MRDDERKDRNEMMSIMKIHHRHNLCTMNVMYAKSAHSFDGAGTKTDEM